MTKPRSSALALARVSSALLLSLLLLLALPAAAEPPAAPAIVTGVVDIQRILQESTAAQQVRQQLDVQRQNFQRQIASDEAKLRELEQELRRRPEAAADANGTSTLSEAEIKQRRELEGRFRALDADARARQRALMEGFEGAMGQIRARLLELVAVLAAERQLQVVFIKEQVMWSAPSIDLTDQLLTRLNAALPNMAVRFEQAPPANPATPAPAPR